MSILMVLPFFISCAYETYGAMRAIGMSDGQLTGMITAEAVTYTASGLLLGCLVGLPLHRMIYTIMITSRWGAPWKLPVDYLLIAVLVLAMAVAAAVYMSVKKIKRLSIMETIGEL